MSHFDIALCVIVVLFGLYGLWKGIMQIILSIVGFIVSVVVAYMFSAEVGAWLGNYIHWPDSARENLAFFLIILVANWVLQVAVWLIEKTVGVVWRLPFVGLANRLTGLLFGGVLGVAVVSVVLAFVLAHSPGMWLTQHIGDSKLLPMFAAIGAAVLPNISNMMELLGQLQETAQKLKT